MQRFDALYIETGCHLWKDQRILESWGKNIIRSEIAKVCFVSLHNSS